MANNVLPMRAGEFLFPAHASLREVLGVLRTARPVQHRLTIPEGLTAAAIAVLLERAETLAGASFHQYQSEECYRRYRDELTRCRNSDGYCLAAFADLQRQCFAATKHANTLLAKYRADD